MPPSVEERRMKKKIAEQRRRARIKENVALHESFKKKDRERKRKNREEGKILNIFKFFRDDIKNDICFAETLVISCTHTDRKADDKGQHEDEDSLSTWTCTSATETTGATQQQTEPVEITNPVFEEEMEEEPVEDDDFHFYFYPDCNKVPAPQHSEQSIILVDGLPQINPSKKDGAYCTCEKKRKGKCSCYTTTPCKCGAKKKKKCICPKLEQVCICDELLPMPVCLCHKNKNVCTCFPELPRTECVCDKVEKICICQKGKFPSPVCTCNHKPKNVLKAESSVPSEASIPAEEGSFSKENSVENESKGEEEPCDCQMSDPKPRCFCRKGRDCTCKTDECVCGVQKACVCEPTESADMICRDTDSLTDKLVCECPAPKVCTCEGEGIECECFPKKLICTCGDPENCKCRKVCDCTEPCVCDTKCLQEPECICMDKEKQIKAGLVCTCPTKEKEPKALKKVRAGKEGYRWCHDVDPYHTYFDYAYGLHDKIDVKEQEKEKFKILGLDSDKDAGVCPIHGTQYAFEKKVQQPSLDCCTSVGGITISVDLLGESGNKFLIQIVSHSSKEGAKTGSKLVSIVDLSLHTMEENRIEHITKKDLTKERKSYMAICDNGYYNKITKFCGDRKVVKRFYHTFEKAREFLLEGANIVLMRYFGLRRYKGTVKTVTVMMDGTLCESIYNSLGTSQAIVNGQTLYVVKVERHIIYPNGAVIQSLTVLSLRGYTISHEWGDNSYVLHVNPLLRVFPDRDEIEQHAPLRDRWREDLQLMSDFLDYKATRTSEGARYVAENGALTSTIRDYLQAILMLKPHDVIHFTRHYFDSALSAMDLPHDEYFDPCPKNVRYYYFEE